MLVPLSAGFRDKHDPPPSRLSHTHTAGIASGALREPMRSALVALLHQVAASSVAAATAPPVLDYARAGLPVFTARHGGLQLNGKRLTLKGLSWFGFEGNNAVVDGLWQRPIDAYMEFIVANHFNALRIPLACNQVLRNPTPADSLLTAEPSLVGMDMLTLLTLVVERAASHGLLVLLDVHRLDSAVWPDPRGLWYSESMSMAELQRAWDVLAQRLCGHWNVFGADLFNEPHGGTWGTGDSSTDWDLAAERLAAGVLDRCSRWVVFVEGIGQAGRKMPEYFWGENLSGSRRKPLQLSRPDKLVYSPHLYGPGQSDYMHYFQGADFASRLPHVWHEHFGFLLGHADVTVVVGEWGGPLSSEADARWQRALVDYLVRNGHVSSFYWCLNPNAGDTGGLLLDDWKTPHAEKLELLRPLHSDAVAPLMRGSPAFPCVGSGLALEPRQADANYFRCGGASGQCIAAVQRCNGVHECADASDEAECDYAPCVTVGGPDRFSACRFPFEYAGHTFRSCTRMDSPTGEAWCPTDVDAVGRYMSYAASGLCGPGCPAPLAAEATRSGLCDGLTGDNGHCAPPPSPPPSPPSPPPSPVSLLGLQALPGSSGTASALLPSLLAVLAMLAAVLAGAGCWLVRKRSTIENLAADWESMRGHATASAVRSPSASTKPHGAVSSDGAAAPPVSGEDDEWYYLDASRRQVGPLPEQALRGLRQSGVLSDAVLVWSERVDAWTPLGQALNG